MDLFKSFMAGAAVAAGALYFGRRWFAPAEPASVAAVEEVARPPRLPALVPDVRRALAFRLHILVHRDKPDARQRIKALREWLARRPDTIPPHPAEARLYRLQYAQRIFPELTNDEALDNLVQLDEAQDRFLRRQRRASYNPRVWQAMNSSVQVRILPDHPN